MYSFINGKMYSKFGDLLPKKKLNLKVFNINYIKLYLY